MKAISCFACAAAALVPVNAASSAATVVLNQVIDAAKVGPPFDNTMLASPVALSIGDTLDLTIRFTGGQRVSIANESYLWPILSTSTPGRSTRRRRDVATRMYDRLSLVTDGTVTILSGVPEPASWALMIAGIGTVGGVARRRGAVTVRYA